MKSVCSIIARFVRGDAIFFSVIIYSSRALGVFNNRLLNDNTEVDNDILMENRF
jgi:hypothetical protein